MLFGMKQQDPSAQETASRYVSEKYLEELTDVRARTWQKYRLLGRGPRFTGSRAL